METRKFFQINGKWNIQNEKRCYTYETSNHPNIPFGEIIGNLEFSRGDISVDVNINTTLEKSSARIIFGYTPKTRHYYSAGLAGYGFSYLIDEFIPGKGWNGLSLIGNVSEMKEKKFNIKIKLIGQNVKLFVDETLLIDYQLPHPLYGKQIGLFTWGNDRVVFNNLKINIEKPKVFIIMNFNEPYLSLYNKVIKPLIIKNFEIETFKADDIFKPGKIMDDIIKSIIESDFIIAEITPDNANIFYELGYAHAINKPTILLADRNRELPFDVAQHRCIFYNDSITARDDFEVSIKKSIDSIVDY